MSRVFTKIADQMLELSSISQGNDLDTYTILAWVKFNHLSSSSSNAATIKAQNLHTSSWWWGQSGSGAILFRHSTAGGQNYRTDEVVPDAIWALTEFSYVNTDPDPEVNSYVDGALVDVFPDSTNELHLKGNTPLTIGGLSENFAYDGKLSHIALLSRPLSEQERLDIASGASFGALSDAGKIAYYPLTDSSLENEWEAISGVGALTVGAVEPSVDETDNPDLTVAEPSAFLSPTNPPQGGEVFSFSGSNYSAQPTGPMTFTQGTRVISRAVTISNWNATDGSFTGVTNTALPGVPADNTSESPALLYNQSVTINLPDPGA